MKVKAKHWLTYEGAWHCGGEEFEISATDADMLKDMVEITETPIYYSDEPRSDAEPAAKKTAVERGKRKASAAAKPKGKK